MQKNKSAAILWLKKAQDNYTFAKYGWDATNIISDTCVLCQQAVEKALKALLEFENINIDKIASLKTHRLADIIAECKKRYPDIEKFADACDKLTVYFFDRYPADIPLNLTLEDAKFALEKAGEILHFVEEIINKDGK